MNRRVAVVGGGPWGVALAKSARRSGAEVTLYSRRPQDDDMKGMVVTTDLKEVAASELIVLAVPTSALRELSRSLGEHLDGRHLLVHGIRGLGESMMTVSDILREETPARRLGALGGPVQASELIDGRPSAMVCGSAFPEVLDAVKQTFRGAWLRVYTTPDLRGLEWASALVGALSIGVGFAEEAGAGPGLLAALIAHGMEDAARLAVAAGAEEKTLLGLAGYGDLLASIAIKDRPEVVLGRSIARGMSLEDAVTEAKLRVEAIGLIPRITVFAQQHHVKAVAFEALAAALRGGRADEILGKLLAA